MTPTRKTITSLAIAIAATLGVAHIPAASATPAPLGSGPGPTGTTIVRNFAYSAGNVLGTEATVHQTATYDALGKAFKQWPTWATGVSIPGSDKFCSGPSNQDITNGTDSHGVQSSVETETYFFGEKGSPCYYDNGTHLSIDDEAFGTGGWNNNGDYSWKTHNCGKGCGAQ
jgi:hypothetical protein